MYRQDWRQRCFIGFAFALIALFTYPSLFFCVITCSYSVCTAILAMEFLSLHVSIDSHQMAICILKQVLLLNIFIISLLQ